MMRSRYRPQQDRAPQRHTQPSFVFPLARDDRAGRKTGESLYTPLAENQTVTASTDKPAYTNTHKMGISVSQHTLPFSVIH